MNSLPEMSPDQAVFAYNKTKIARQGLGVGIAGAVKQTVTPKYLQCCSILIYTTLIQYAPKRLLQFALSKTKKKERHSK